MKPATLARSLFWTLVAAAAAVALTSTAFVFRRAATAQTASTSKQPAKAAPEGVVCFGTVDLEHGVAALNPLQPGRVVEILVHENQEVAQGTELLRLDDATARIRLAEAEAALKSSRIQLEQARKLPEQQRGRVDRQKAVLEAMLSRLTAGRQVLAQRQKQTQPAFVNAVDLAQSELQVRELEALERVESLRLAELKAQDVDAEVHRAEYELAVAEARREQARLAVDECRLKAPRPGTILRIMVGPGDILGGERGQPAVLFAPEGPQVIRATVEQEFASRVKEGEEVVVRDEADDTVSSRGRVDRVAAWYSQRRAVLHDPTELSDVRTLECVIALEPGQPRLRLGQGVRVFIGTVPP